MSETAAKSACSWVSVVPVDVIKNKHKYLAKKLSTYFIKKKNFKQNLIVCVKLK
jgi:hypothetical protein